MPPSDENAEKSRSSESTSDSSKEPDAPAPKPETSREIVVALAIMALLFVIQLLTEHTSVVEATKTQAFSYFQGLLSATTAKRLPIVVLDIGDIPLDERKHTNRKQLAEVIDALNKAGAAAVGIDVDMSPDASGFINRDEDPDLFEQWKKLSVDMPVVVGVYRTRNLSPERWLGLPAFASLGGFLGTAKTPDGNRVSRMQSHYEPSDGMEHSRAQEHVSRDDEALPTLGYALSAAYLAKRKEPFPQPGRIVRMLIEPVEGGEEDRLVNFSKVGQVERERTLNTHPDAISGPDARNYKDKIVLLGDIEPQDIRADSFFAPGSDRLPGVLYHASAVWTFAFEPVYEFNWWTRTILDLFLGSLFIVAVWARTRFVLDERKNKRWILRFLEQYALVGAICLLVFIGFVAMRVFHIMWLDTIVVAFGLLVHYLLPQQVKELFPASFRKSHS